MTSDTRYLIINEEHEATFTPSETQRSENNGDVDCTVDTCKTIARSTDIVDTNSTGNLHRQTCTEKVFPSGGTIYNGAKLDVEGGAKLDVYILVAIISALLCCPPFGACATYYAYRARLAARLRDEDKTALYTSRATTLIVWTIFTGLMILMFNVLFLIVKIQKLKL